MCLSAYGRQKLANERARIDLTRIPLQCVRTIEPERGSGEHFPTFAVFVHPKLDSVPLFVGMRERSICAVIVKTVFHIQFRDSFDKRETKLTKFRVS